MRDDGRDFKGIAGCVLPGLQKLVNWDYDLLSIADLNGLEFQQFRFSADFRRNKEFFALKEIKFSEFLQKIT